MPEPTHRPTLGTISIENSVLLTDGADIAELSTDTGWVWRAEAGLAGGSVNRVAVFDDTRRLLLRGLEDDNTPVSEFAVELNGPIASSSCFRLVVVLGDQESADVRADSC